LDAIVGLTSIVLHDRFSCLTLSCLIVQLVTVSFGMAHSGCPDKIHRAIKWLYVCMSYCTGAEVFKIVTS